MSTPTLIRQNPTPLPKAPPGEICPRHGMYRPGPAAAELRRMATRPGVPVTRAREWLAAAERARRACPACDGPAPTVPRWARLVAARVTA